jgi:hypothetical protein
VFLMGTAAGLLAEARKSLGLRGRPNYITRSYAGRHGDVFLKAPWCDMAVTYWARQSANTAAVLPGGDRAFTVWHADDFRKIGRWHTGTIANLNRSRPGDVVFFDWGQSNTIAAIDHVGVVERVLGDGRVQTIEGNTDNACLRRIRSASVIAGFGRPAYDSSTPKPPQEEDMPLTDAEIEKIAKRVWTGPGMDFLTAPGLQTGETFPSGPDTGNKTWYPASFPRQAIQGFWWLGKKVDALAAAGGVDVDEDAIVQGVLAGLSPATIAGAVVDALPPDLAMQVVSEIGTRLGQPDEAETPQSSDRAEE